MVAGGCGDWDVIERKWTLLRFYSMVDHWKKNGPPVYISVALYLGLNKPGKSAPHSGPPTEAEVGDLSELEAMFSGNGGVIGGHG